MPPRKRHGLRDAARKIAHAIREGAEGQVDRRGPGRYRATILRWNGIEDFDLDLQGQDMQLDERDVILGSTVRRHHRDTGDGLREGDVLVLEEVSEGEFTAVEVESDRTVAWEHNFRDAEGNQIVYIADRESH